MVPSCNKFAAIALAAICLAYIAAKGLGTSGQVHDDSTAYLITYAVADLPVWRNDGSDKLSFDPQILVDQIQSKVDPPSWSTHDIRPVADKVCLVIEQTRANHERIADLLEEFRNKDSREVTERIVR